MNIDHLGADITVKFAAVAHTLRWQKNSGNKWRKMGEDPRSKTKRLLVALDVRIGMKKRWSFFFTEYVIEKAL